VKSDQTLALVSRANPVHEEELPGAASVHAQTLKERILLTEQNAPDVRLRPRRRLLVAATTAAAVALAAVVTLPRALPNEHLGASPAAAAVLERAAVAATRRADVAAGRYAYTKAKTLYGGTNTDDPPFTVLYPTVRESWVAADGSGRVVEVEGKPFFLGPRDRERWQASGGRLGDRERIERRVRARAPVPADVLAADPEDLDLAQLDQLLNAGVPQLPTDPDRLERLIRAYAEKKDPPVEAAMFNEVSGLLHSPFASGELRAALYRVLAGIEGVELVGQRRNADGRVGTAISAPAGYGGSNDRTPDPQDSTLNTQLRRYLIIDPRTGNVLAEETVLTRRVDWIDGKPGDVVGSIVILEQGWVDSLEQRDEQPR
jgi:hypothetical protein